jgi:hypothetical protein
MQTATRSRRSRGISDGSLGGFRQRSVNDGGRSVVVRRINHWRPSTMSDESSREPYVQDVLADLHAIRGLMNDGRPLEALAHVNDSITKLEDELDD